MPVRWLGALIGLTLPLAAIAQTPPEQTPQALFEGLLVEDPRTTAAVRDLLRSDAGSVWPRPLFADLTGDGRMDAVVTVHTGGAAGIVAVYAFSADGTRDVRLRAVFRSQSLYRATPRFTPGTLTVAMPRYARGDDVCCAAARAERDYTWDARRHVLRPRAERLIRLHD